MPSAKISFLSAIFKFPYVGWFCFGFCVVGDEKQKRDIQIQFRSYRPNRRDESRYASKTDIIILHLSKKSKPLFDVFLKKSRFLFIMNEKKLQKSSLFLIFALHFPPEHTSNAAEKHVFPRTKTAETSFCRRILRHLSCYVHIKFNPRSNQNIRHNRRRSGRARSRFGGTHTRPSSNHAQVKLTCRTPGSCRA